MANPGGKNSPSSFAGFTEGTPYGEKKQAAQLQAAAPVAGAGASGQALGTPRRATEVALKAAAKPRPTATVATGGSAEPPVVPVAPQPSAGNPSADAWRQAAATPGASPLVQQYAAAA